MRACNCTKKKRIIQNLHWQFIITFLPKISHIFFRNITTSKDSKSSAAPKTDYQQSQEQIKKKNLDSWKAFAKRIILNSSKRELTQTHIPESLSAMTLLLHHAGQITQCNITVHIYRPPLISPGKETTLSYQYPVISQCGIFPLKVQ